MAKEAVPHPHDALARHFLSAEDLAITTAEELRREGEAIGEAKGKAEGKAETIITFLEARFGTVSASVQKSILRHSDEAVLGSLTALAATCKSLDEFKRGLKK